ncbi:MAG TPA: hypothetical protein VEA69_15540 [Tepidisphaeraceae bacterium]|nr:hypothetical protein [Tepidisphaeraceae bacterium]
MAGKQITRATGTNWIGWALAVALLTTVAARPAAPAEDVKPKPAAKPPEPKANVVAGVATDERGNVIAGGTVHVFIAGVAFQSGQRNEFTTEAGEDGRFEFEVPPGQWKVTAQVAREYNGRQYQVDLAPVDGKGPFVAQNSRAGIVRNFVWRLTGLRAGREKGLSNSYYGVAVLLEDAQAFGPPASRIPAKYAGGKVVLRFAPKGPLLDGTKIDPFEREFPTARFANPDTSNTHTLVDVPIGDYAVSARIVTAEGKDRPLKLTNTAEGGKDAAERVDVTFTQPSLGERVRDGRMVLSE